MSDTSNTSNLANGFTGCAFSALSTQGRWGRATPAGIAAGNTWGSAYVWIGGISWNDVAVWAHELGHSVSCLKPNTISPIISYFSLLLKKLLVVMHAC